MSIQVTSLSEELEQFIIDTLYVEKIDGNPFARPKFIKKEKTIVKPYRMNNEQTALYLPFQWSLTNLPNIKRPDRSDYDRMDTQFTTTLRDVQREIKDDCISMLNQKGCVLISLYPGAGKTCLSIYLASKIGLKTLIICHRLVLIEQWKKAIQRFIKDARIGFLQSGISEKKFKKEMDNDFLLVNAQNVKKIGWESLKTVGLVIIDEIHAIMAESLSECLGYVTPRYLIGLSATPHRPDGLDGLLDFYFGEENKIMRELYHPHDVYQIQTSIEYEEDSKTQWTSMITSQCLNESRNQLIVDIIRHFSDRHFLVLCKRVEQAKWIHTALEEEKESSTLMVEDTNEFDEKARVIVSSIQKCGVGFSHDVLDALILASDVEEYFIQYLARVMRTEEVKPIVFDLVDCHPSLKKHFSSRKAVYKKAGGVIKNFYKEFPSFRKI